MCPFQYRRRFRFIRSTVVQIRGISRTGRLAMLVQLYKVDVFGNRPSASVFQNLAVLNGILDIEQQPGRCAVVAVINEDSSTLHHIYAALPYQVQCSIQQRMSGADERGRSLSLHVAELFIEAHPLIAMQHRLSIADLRVAIPHGIGNGSDFTPAFLSAANLSAHGLERLHKECLNEMGWSLCASMRSISSFDSHDRMNIHHIIGQSIFFNELELVPFYGVVYHFIQAGFHLGVVSIPYCLNEQVTEERLLNVILPRMSNTLPPSA